MADAGMFEVWRVDGEQPPAPPDGVDGGGFEIWGSTGDLPSVVSFAGAEVGPGIGRHMPVMISAYRSVRAGERWAG